MNSSSSVPHTEAPLPTSPDRLRQTCVAASAVLAVIGSFIGSGAAGGTPVQEASGGALAADATLLAPGGPAFAIWTPIYLGLVAYAVWQFLPAQRTLARHRALGYPIAASLILNAAWILSVQFNLLWLSVPIIVLLLAVLVRAFVLTLRLRPQSLIDTIVTDGTVGLYLGWVSVATVANITAALVAAGFSGFGVDGTVWAIAVLVVTTLVGLAVAVRGAGRLAPTLALAWGLTWVGVARLTGDLFSIPTGIAALCSAGLVVIVTIVLRLRSAAARSRVA